MQGELRQRSAELSPSRLGSCPPDRERGMVIRWGGGVARRVFWLLGAAPFVWAGLYLLGRSLISDPATVARYNWAEYLLTKAVAAAGALLAMSVFTRNDVLWKA